MSVTGRGLRNAGVRAALGSAVLFGCATPAGKLLLGDFGPWVLAGLLYLGSGLGLTCYRWVVRAPRVRLAGADRWWLAAAVGAGGVVAPVLALVGLTGMPAAGASLLLNVEAVLTAGLAWLVFGENVAGALMGLGVWLHLSERHIHEHIHEGIEHDHPHRHDDPHHQHGALGSVPDSHAHVHPPVRHSHEHYPDSHHRHPH